MHKLVSVVMPVRAFGFLYVKGAVYKFAVIVVMPVRAFGFLYSEFYYIFMKNARFLLTCLFMIFVISINTEFSFC